MQWRESAADRKSEVAVQGVKFETSTLGFTIAWSKISPGRSLKWWLLIHMVSHRDCDSYNLSLNSIELLWIQAVLPWASWRCLDAMQVWSADTWTIWLNPKKIHNTLCTCSSEWTRLGACSQIQPHLRNPSSAHQKNGSLMIQPRCPLRISYLCEFVVGTTFEVIKIFEQHVLIRTDYFDGRCRASQISSSLCLGASRAAFTRGHGQRPVVILEPELA